MENTTIEKLSGAINQLMVAYEKLQSKYDNLRNENNSLKESIQKLEKEKSSLSSDKKILENEKVSLENNIANLSTSTADQSTHMNTMLSKIESILNVDSVNAASPSLDFNKENIQEDAVPKPADTPSKQEIAIDNNIYKAPEEKAETIADLTNKSQEQQENNNISDSNSNKIDLGRMESLLNGL